MRKTSIDVPDATLLFRLIFALANRLRVRMDTLLAEVDLTTQQAAVLTICEGAANPPTQGELAVKLGTSHQNVRQLLDVLVRKRFVRVVVDEDDRRVRRVHMRNDVKKLFAERDTADHVQIRAWLSALTDAEVRRATQILLKALTALDDGELGLDARVGSAPPRDAHGARERRMS